MTQAGTLWVVATPIGNLEDLSPRAARVLAEVSLIAAEDTRHTRKLLNYFGIQTRLVSLHEHNESRRVGELLAQLQAGADIALVSDAGTPLISDPGFGLVATARNAGVTVCPIPGPCALIAALSVAGLPTDRFHFEGFLPAKSGARQKRLEALASNTETLILYEAPQRMAACLADLEAVFGAPRRAVVCKELTKLHEATFSGSLGELIHQFSSDSSPRGEYVVMVAGAPPADADARLEDGRRLFELLRKEMPPGKAAALAAKFTDCRRNALYQ